MTEAKLIHVKEGEFVLFICGGMIKILIYIMKFSYFIELFLLLLFNSNMAFVFYSSLCIFIQLTDQTRYYIASDNELMIDIFKSEINFLKSSWQNMLGRPLVIMTINSVYLGKNRILMFESVQFANIYLSNVCGCTQLTVTYG